MDVAGERVAPGGADSGDLVASGIAAGATASDGRVRLLFIDNLRWSAIAMVVVMHAAVTYSPFGSWYFRDGAGTGRTAAICFATYQSFQHAVSMGLLFTIAGFFASASLRRKGALGFLRERAFRLGLPLLLYMFLVGPATAYFVAGSWVSYPPRSFGADWLHHVADGAILSESGPLWFCLVLLVFSLLFALIPARRFGMGGPVPGVGPILGFALAMAALTFAVGLAAPNGGTVLNVDIHDFPQYPLMFAAGVLAQRGGWPMRFDSRSGVAWAIGGVVLGGIVWFLIVTLGGALHGQLRSYGGGWHWQAAAMDLWRSGMCVALTLGLITLYRDHFNRQGPVTRFLSRNAFGVYVFHPPILIAVTRVLHEWPVDVSVKFFTASAVGVVATFLFVGSVARRTPLLRAIL